VKGKTMTDAARQIVETKSSEKKLAGWIVTAIVRVLF
jgi:hypothetical protein